MNNTEVKQIIYTKQALEGVAENAEGGCSEGKAFPSYFLFTKPIFDIFYIDFVFGKGFFYQSSHFGHKSTKRG